MAAGQPSVYGPVKLWGPTTMGSMACIYGPVGANVVQVTGITVTNLLTSPSGIGFYVGPSGSTGAATGAYGNNMPIPSTGNPIGVVPNIAPPLTITNSQVIHAMSSMASGIITFGFGIEMQ